MTQQFPTSNNLPIHHLAACFNNTSATYKFYWLLALLDEIQDGQRELDKHKLFAHMISNAWYTVNYFQISFGQQDLIQDAVRQLKDIEGITIDAPKTLINDRLVGSDNPLTRKLLFHFDKQVPHWFLSPWYPKNNRQNIYQLSQQNIDQPLYHLYNEYSEESTPPVPDESTPV